MPDWKPTKRIKDPSLIRRFRLEHAGEPCEVCELRPGIHAHHRKFRSQMGSDHESNLAWLCSVCHHAEHGIHEVVGKT